MYKNIGSQKVAVFAWDGANGAAKTGDAANITAEISLDGAASAPTNDTNPTELDSTDHPGIYIFDLTQAETNADLVVITPVSSTSDIVIRPIIATPTLLTSTKAGYIDASIQTVDTVVDGIQTDLSNGTDGLGALKTLIDALNNISTADVNAQMLDVLNIDTFAEPGDEIPASTTTLVNKIGYIYKFLRNKIETTETRIHIYDDAGSNKDHSAVISDDGTTFTRGEFAAGD